MRKVYQIAVAALLFSLLGACATGSRPLGKMDEQKRNRTLVLDRTDEEVAIDERRTANEATKSHWMKPRTWF